MVMFLALHPLETLSLNSFILLEHLAMLLIITNRIKLLMRKLLKQGYRYHKLRKTFSKVYRRYYDLISQFQIGLKSLLRQGLSEPTFCGELVYKLKKIVGSNYSFSAVGILGQVWCLIVSTSFLLCYERDLMLSLSDNNQADVIETFLKISI